MPWTHGGALVVGPGGVAGSLETAVKGGLNVLAIGLSADEANKLYQMRGKHAGVAQTRQTLDEYIKVIREESKKLRRDDVKSMSGEELNRYLEQLRNAKK